MDGLSLLLPNRPLSRRSALLLYALWPLLFVFCWSLSTNRILPNPVEVLRTIPELWLSGGLGIELWTSLSLNLEAVALLTVFSLSLAYATVLPVFRPFVNIFAVGRFNGFVGLPLIFTLWLRDPHYVKLALLVFGASVFAVPSIVHVIGTIPKAAFDHARTLRMSEWRAFYEVAVLGRLDEVIDILGANAAMIWMLVPMVEILFRSEGGIGSMAVDFNKHMDLAAVYGIAFVVSVTGGAQDIAIGFIKSILCPYSNIGLEHA